MTTGPHPAAAQGGGRQSGLSSGPLVGRAAEKTSWAAGEKKLGCAGGNGPEAKKEKGEKRKPFSFFFPSKELTRIEFKHKFEFKQTKTMQQHVCNSKLL
jgi:hypothetical protein